MKTFINLFFIILVSIMPCFAQGPHTYGPKFENHFATQCEEYGSWDYHYVGVNAGQQGVVTYRNCNF